MHRHNFIKSDREGYEVCTDCGTYHSTALLSPDELYQVYWGGEGGTSRSTISQQRDNFNCIDDCGISKADRVMQFVPKRGKNALEIGCSPAVILNRLLDRNFTVWGIEPSERYIPFLREQAPEAHIVQGYFPEVTSRCEEGVFSCIISLDVAEHIDDFQGFFNEIHRLLTPDGTAIIMSPIILNRDGLIKKSDFIASEHAWIWTERFLEEYLKEFFKEVSFHRWINGHEIILLKK